MQSPPRQSAHRATAEWGGDYSGWGGVAAAIKSTLERPAVQSTMLTELLAFLELLSYLESVRDVHGEDGSP